MKRFAIVVSFLGLVLFLSPLALFAQTPDVLELTLDLNSWTTPTPKIMRANIDLSGRGFHKDNTWPQSLASPEALATWKREIGFNGFYRLQYNLWEISELAKDKVSQDKILANYDDIIKSVSDSGGVVILNLFGTPRGMGKILDAKSAPIKNAQYKELIKSRIKELSCEKKYNIWYEVWNAPDLGDFFLGREQEYLNMYRLVSESIKELEAQYKIQIPVGGPGTSWWFHNLDGNTILSPEKSLIYILIKFCDYNNLPLDFITWHAFSSDPQVESELTIYKKDAIKLLRDWLSYFKLDNNTPLIVDEWNYDRDANLLPARQEKAYISASYIPARIKNMHEAGLDNQVFFSLEDFQDNLESLTRNVGVFFFGQGRSINKSGFKASYNVFRMLKALGPDIFSAKIDDRFVGSIATRSQDELALLIYNYIDPDIINNYLSDNIAVLNPQESKFVLNAIRQDTLGKLISTEGAIDSSHATPKVKALLKKALELNKEALQFTTANRNIKITLKNIKGEYHYSRFSVDSSCSLNCEYKPVEEKEMSLTDTFQEDLSVSPYSVTLIILKKKQVLPE